MIGFIAGTVLDKNHSAVLVETASGVGYEINLASTHLAMVQIGQTVRLFTYLKVSDSAQELSGFVDSEARDFFKLLLGVSGIGPKSALNILSLGSIEAIKQAIARNDVNYLTAVQGMGKKTAERLVVELKSKLKGTTSVTEMPAGATDTLGEVVEGLIAMGYSAGEARTAVQSLSLVGKTTEQLLREALRQLSK